MAGTDVILELAGISKAFDREAGAPVAVLEEVSLKVCRGESVAIMGPSGSGKSTLLQIMGTLDQPTRGKVTLRGREVSGLDEAALAVVRNRELGFVFQAHYLLPQLSVIENVLVPTLAAAAKGGRTEACSRAERLLKRVGLEERMGHLPGQLSGGERQRVAVVRALINEPGVVLADEPTGALDQDSARELGELLAEVNAELGATLVVVTHSAELAQRMGRVFELKHRRLVLRQAGQSGSRTASNEG